MSLLGGKRQGLPITLFCPLFLRTAAEGWGGLDLHGALTHCFILSAWHKELGRKQKGTKHPRDALWVMVLLYPYLLPSCEACSFTLSFTLRENFMSPWRLVLGKQKGLFSNKQPTMHMAEGDRPPRMHYSGLGCKLSIHLWAIALAADSPASLFLVPLVEQWAGQKLFILLEIIAEKIVCWRYKCLDFLQGAEWSSESITVTHAAECL